MKNTEIVRLAVDSYKGMVQEYSAEKSQDVLRKALIEVNNGSTKLDIKAIRDGKCPGLFTIIEEILRSTVVEGLQEDDYFMAMVDFRNLAEGDMNEFVVEDNDLFVVSEAADGTQGVRRQRLSGSTVTSIPTSLKVVRMYEELNRVLAGRIDFNELIDKVTKSTRIQLLNDVHALWSSITKDQIGGSAYFNTAGSYNEDQLIEVISHVEAAANGQAATIIGTKAALRKLNPSIQAEVAKADLYNLGYMGKFFGTPVVAIPQRHKIGTTDFAIEDDTLTIVAGDTKPIKVVYEGDPIILPGDPLRNADYTQEYLYGEKYGMGVVVANNGGIGRYKIA